MKAATGGRAICLGVLVGMLASPLMALADGATISPEAAQILADVQAARSKRTAEDRNAAKRLNAQGDSAYKLKNYEAAYKAYSNSFPNFPTSYAYLMSADTQWRSLVQFQRKRAVQDSMAAPACLEATGRFIHGMRMDLAQHYEVGLALASAERDKQMLKSAMFARARESFTCLQTVAKELEALPANSCVDIDRVQQCLGEPLLK
jgi:hypothetical protein